MKRILLSLTLLLYLITPAFAADFDDAHKMYMWNGTSQYYPTMENLKTDIATDVVDPAISTHAEAADPHTGYALESSLGDSATLNVGTAAGTVAAGDSTGILVNSSSLHGLINDSKVSPYVVNTWGGWRVRAATETTDRLYTLSTPTVAFLAGDVGKIIIIEGKGVETNHVATITTVTSAYDITFSPAVTWTTDVVDTRIVWGTNNTEALQNGLNSAATAGKIAVLPPGRYLATDIYLHYDAVNNPGWPQNKSGRIGIIGAGVDSFADVINEAAAQGTTIELSGGLHGSGIIHTNLQSLILVGHGDYVVDFQAASQGVNMQNFSVFQRGDGGGVYLKDTYQVNWENGVIRGLGTSVATTNIGIQIENINTGGGNIVLEGIVATRFRLPAVIGAETYTGTNAMIASVTITDGCEFSYGKTAGLIIGEGVRQATVSHSYIEQNKDGATVGTESAAGVWVKSKAENVTIKENYFTSNDISVVLGNSGISHDDGIYGAVVEKNQIASIGRYGVLVYGNDNSANKVIRDNTFRENTSYAGTSTAIEVEAEDQNGLTISGNFIPSAFDNLVTNTGYIDHYSALEGYTIRNGSMVVDSDVGGTTDYIATTSRNADKSSGRLFLTNPGLNDALEGDGWAIFTEGSDGSLQFRYAANPGLSSGTAGFYLKGDGIYSTTDGGQSIGASTSSRFGYIRAKTAFDLGPLTSAPGIYDAGSIVYADGTSWDPGAGAGFYGYEGSLWVKMTASGTYGLSVTTHTNSGTTLAGQSVARFNTGNFDRTATLPAVAGNTGRLYYLIKTDAGTGVVVIDGNGAETINGVETITLAGQWSVVLLECNGSSWEIIGGNVLPNLTVSSTTDLQGSISNSTAANNGNVAVSDNLQFADTKGVCDEGNVCADAANIVTASVAVVAAVSTSAGAEDSGKLPKLNASGLIDGTMLPATGGLTGIEEITSGTISTTVLTTRLNRASVSPSVTLPNANTVAAGTVKKFILTGNNDNTRTATVTCTASQCAYNDGVSSSVVFGTTTPDYSHAEAISDGSGTWYWSFSGIAPL